MAERINAIIWGAPTVFLLIFTGVIFTVKLRFIQFGMFSYILGKLKKGRNIRPQLKTSCMALGAAMGTGNITGVASALSIGGPGAVFWMWVSAFLGMATVYAENHLSALYTDECVKGPMAYLQKGIGSRLLAGAFAVCCVLASFGMGGMVQISSMSESINNCVDISPLLLSFIIFAAVFLTIKGGASRIGSTAQLLLPVASIAYAAICATVIAVNCNRLPGAISAIIRGAFGVKQTLGGSVGYTVSAAVSAGIRRGIFSNEAGLGSSPLLHSSAKSSRSVKTQGMCSMLEVFIDTMLCCTLTALTLLCSGTGNDITQAFELVTGEHTEYIIAAIMTLFALCTVIGWYYCGETAFHYLFSHHSNNAFPFVFAIAAASGAIFSARTLWTVSDIFNGLMLLSNIVGLLFLAPKVKNE